MNIQKECKNVLSNIKSHIIKELMKENCLDFEEEKEKILEDYYYQVKEEINSLKDELESISIQDLKDELQEKYEKDDEGLSLEEYIDSHLKNKLEDLVDDII